MDRIGFVNGSDATKVPVKDTMQAMDGCKWRR